MGQTACPWEMTCPISPCHPHAQMEEALGQMCGLSRCVEVPGVCEMHLGSDVVVLGLSMTFGGSHGCHICECSVMGPGGGRRMYLGNFPIESLVAVPWELTAGPGVTAGARGMLGSLMMGYLKRIIASTVVVRLSEDERALGAVPVVSCLNAAASLSGLSALGRQLGLEPL